MVQGFANVPTVALPNIADLVLSVIIFGDDAGGITRYQTSCRDILGQHRTRGDRHIVTNADGPREDYTGANPNVVADVGQTPVTHCNTLTDGDVVVEHTVPADGGRADDHAMTVHHHEPRPDTRSGTDLRVVDMRDEAIHYTMGHYREHSDDARRFSYFPRELTKPIRGNTMQFGVEQEEPETLG